MKAGVVNPFIKTLPGACRDLTGEVFRYGDVTVVRPGEPVRDKGAFVFRVPVEGHLNGDVVYSVDVESARRMASRMLFSLPLQPDERVVETAVAEVVQRAAAEAVGKLREIGFQCLAHAPRRVLPEEAMAPWLGIRTHLRAMDDTTVVTDLFLKEVPAHRLPINTVLH